MHRCNKAMLSDKPRAKSKINPARREGGRRRGSPAGVLGTGLSFNKSLWNDGSDEQEQHTECAS